MKNAIMKPHILFRAHVDQIGGNANGEGGEIRLEEVGAMTDFGPLIANPISFLMGAAAQFGIFSAYFLAILFGFNDKAAAVDL